MKKGEVNAIMAVAIVFAVLTVSLLGAYYLYSDQKNDVDKIPGFEQGTLGRESIEILRYDLSKGEVKSYDGNTWSYFKDDRSNRKTAVLEGKTFYEDDFRREIEEWYFDLNVRTGDKRIVLSSKKEENPSTVFYSGKLVPLLDGFIFSFFSDDEYGADGEGGEGLRGEVKVSLVSKGGFETGEDYTQYGYFILSRDNLLRFFKADSTEKVWNPSNVWYGKEEVPPNWNEKDKLISEAADWRDSILKGGGNPKMISISYYDDSEAKREIKTCVEKINNKYLIVDFSKRVSKDEDCK